MRLVALIALLALAAPAHGINSGGTLRRVLIYGDSMLDDGEINSALTGAGFAVLNAAESGAVAAQSASCNGNEVPDPQCINGGGRMLQQEGVCWGAEDLDGDESDEASCAADNASPTTGVVMMYGTNESVGIALGTLTLEAAQTSFTALLDEADALGLACVWIVPPPRLASVQPLYTYQDAQEAIESMRDWLVGTEMANHPDCVLVDAYQIGLDYWDAYGTALFLEMYETCPVLGGLLCVHWRADDDPNTRGDSLALMVGRAVRSGLVESFARRHAP